MEKRNPPNLLMGMYIGAATMQNSMEVPLKTELPYDPAILLLSINQEKTKTQILLLKVGLWLLATL